jgi:hypothetical protein
VVRDRPEQQGRRDGGQRNAGEVQVTLALVQLTEPDGERQREQEAEQHLDAERDDAEFLNQLGEVTVITLGKGLWPLILGLLRIACTYHSRAATRS